MQNVRGGMGNYDNSSFNYLTSPEWTAENMRLGPIGDLVRCWGDGKQMSPDDVMDVIGPYKGESVQELADMGYIMWTSPQPIGTLYGDGDSGCFYNLIGNGLRAWQDPTWGGWSGRWDSKSGTPRSGHPTYMSTDIIAMHNRTVEAANNGTTVDLLSMFGLGGGNSSEEDHTFPNMYAEKNLAEAARMKWSVTPNYEDANHYPVLTGSLNIRAKAGEKVEINATASDPDGDQLDIKWWYFSVGSYDGAPLAVDSQATAQTTFSVPKDAKSGDTIHLVLQAIDHGMPTLTKYRRTIITVL